MHDYFMGAVAIALVGSFGMVIWSMAEGDKRLVNFYSIPTLLFLVLLFLLGLFKTELTAAETGKVVATVRANVDEKRDEDYFKLLLDIQRIRFTVSCDRAGNLIDNRSQASNCIERDGFRVWALDSKYYVGTIMNENAAVDIIFDADRLIERDSEALIYASNELDKRKLTAAFSR